MKTLLWKLLMVGAMVMTVLAAGAPNGYGG